MTQLTVKGTGSVREKPDTVEIVFTLSVVREVYADCAAEAVVQLERLRAALEQAGHKSAALKTSSFQLSARYDNKPAPKGGYERVFAGYECTHRLTLRFRLIASLLDATLAAVGDGGAYADFSVRFMLKDDRKTKAALLKVCAADARDKAETLAAALGKRLGDVLSVEYGAHAPTPYSRTEFAPKARVMAASLDITPEDVENTDSVTVVYALA